MDAVPASAMARIGELYRGWVIAASVAWRVQSHSGGPGEEGCTSVEVRDLLPRGVPFCPFPCIQGKGVGG